MHALRERALGEAAIGTSHHAVATHQLRDPHEPLRDELGMLDDVRVMRDDPGNQHASLGKADVLPQRPLVFVARVGLLDQVIAGGDLEHEIDDVGERRVERVRTVPAPPADVVAHPFGGQARAVRG